MLNRPELRDQLLKALGPLAGLYADGTVNRIFVDSYQRININQYTNYGLSEKKFDSPEAFQKMIEDVLALYRVALEPGQTVIDLRLDENARMQIVLPPTALQGPYVVIRKLPDVRPSLEQLIQLGVVTRPIVDLLQEMLYQNQNILVVGGKNSNKNVTAALLAERIPLGARVAIIEREHEMQVNHPNAFFLEANGDSYTGLIQAAARMSPNWLILSELAGPEAMTVMDLLSRGFYGVATLYANGVQDALKRLEMMCLMANPGLGLEQIRVLIATALQVIVYQQPVGGYLDSKLIEIVELAGVDGGQYLLQPLVTYNLGNNCYETSGIEPTWRQKD